MQLQHVFAARRLMQPVDILRYNGFQLALALQLRDDIGVVDNAPEHRAAMRLGRFVRKRDRALHAVAEACGLSKNDPHSGAPPTA